MIDYKKILKSGEGGAYASSVGMFEEDSDESNTEIQEVTPDSDYFMNKEDTESKETEK